MNAGTVTLETRGFRVRARTPDGTSKSWSFETLGNKAFDEAHAWLESHLKSAVPLPPSSSEAPPPSPEAPPPLPPPAADSPEGSPQDVALDSSVSAPASSSTAMPVDTSEAVPDPAAGGEGLPAPSSDVAIDVVTDPVKSAIETRAAAISKLGTFWGFAEFLAWGFSTSTRVVMLFGEGSVDLFAVFANAEIGPPVCTPAFQIMYSTQPPNNLTYMHIGFVARQCFRLRVANVQIVFKLVATLSSTIVWGRGGSSLHRGLCHVDVAGLRVQFSSTAVVCGLGWGSNCCQVAELQRG